MDNSRLRKEMDAPALGASVVLVETSVGELMELFKLAQAGDTAGLMVASLAASLEIDGERFTVAQLRDMGARKWKQLRNLGPDALRINGIVEDEPEVEEGEEPAQKKQ